LIVYLGASQIAGGIYFIQIQPVSLCEESFKAAGPQDRILFELEVEWSNSGMIASEVKRPGVFGPQAKRPVSDQLGKAGLAPLLKRSKDDFRICSRLGIEAQRPTEILIVIDSTIERQHVARSIYDGTGVESRP
jgi:hypothetical protein